MQSNEIERTTRPHIHVVAAVIEHNGSILAAQRGYGDFKGQWEFPGGKVRDGESNEDALRREIKEELKLDLGSLWYLDSVSWDYPDFHLDMDCYGCSLIEGSKPTRTEHLELRWLSPGELLSVEWLPADRDLVYGIGQAWEELFSKNRL